MKIKLKVLIKINKYMASILEVLFEFLIAFLLFLFDTFSFISFWAGKFIYLAFSSTTITEIVLVSIIVGIVLTIFFKIGISTSKTIFIILLVILAIIALIVLI